jgi:hypothetical protein
MGYTVDDFLGVTPEQQESMISSLKLPQCYCGCNCGQPLEPTMGESRNYLNKRPVNEDCYWSRVGDEIEKFPIRSPKSEKNYKK